MNVGARYLLTLAGLAAVLAVSGDVYTQTTGARRVLNVSTGLVGLPLGHTAKLTLANVGRRTAPPAIARLVILDEKDQVLAVQTVIVGPGRPASVQVSRDKIPRTDDRVPVRASVLNPIGTRGRNDLVFTLEIFNTTSSLSPSLAALICPQKIPDDQGDFIDCEDPCGCVVGFPGDFAGATGGTPTP